MCNRYSCCVQKEILRGASETELAGSSLNWLQIWLDPHFLQNIRWDLVMKKFLRPFSPIGWFKEGSCQVLAKEFALSNGKLPRRLAQEQCG